VAKLSSTYQALEPAPRIAYAAAAATLFVRAIMKHLPPDARAELDATPDDEDAVCMWARRWHVECPCVIEWAHGDVTIRVQSGGRFRSGGRGFGYDLPPDWWETLHELNNTVLDASGLDARDVGWARDPERSLAPIAANPMAESRDTFLLRASGHWEARAALAYERGYTPIVSAPKLELVAEWIARHHLRGTSVPDLAREAPDQIMTASNVHKQMTKFRRAIGLPPRLKPGRPRKRTAS
jgi:hypothetical protein